MTFVVYVLAVLSLLWAGVGLYAYQESKHRGVLLSSIVSIAFALLAIRLVHWWPLVASFGVQWALRLIGLDPSAPKHRRHE